MLICNAPERRVLLMLPSTDCRIDDTWFVVGLRGSGSKDVVVEGAFVPRHRAVSMNDVREGCPRPSNPRRSQLPHSPAEHFVLHSIGVSAGNGLGWVGCVFGDYPGAGVGAHGREVRRVGGAALRLAETDAELRAAQALLKHNCAEIFGKARDSQSFTLEERARYRRDQSYIARLSVQAIDRVFAASGGRALFEPIRCSGSTGTFMPRPPTYRWRGTLQRSSSGRSGWDSGWNGRTFDQ